MAGLILCSVTKPIAAQTPIPQQPIQPSLWWAADRFGQNLIEDLRVDQNSKTVEVRVKEGVWNTWDYLQRYVLMRRLGGVAIAEDFGIQIIGNRQKQLAQYIQTDGKWQLDPPDIGANPFRPHSANSRTFSSR